MEKTHPSTCVLCGAPAVDAPRIHIRQEHDLDAPVAHHLAFCDEHGTELSRGQLTPQQIIYDWATHAHADLYRNERMVLVPELRCLACNALLADGNGTSPAEIACAACGAMNELGSALGHRVAVRIVGPRSS
jgi:phage FluMu protein Com